MVIIEEISAVFLIIGVFIYRQLHLSDVATNWYRPSLTRTCRLASPLNHCDVTTAACSTSRQPIHSIVDDVSTQSDKCVCTESESSQLVARDDDVSSKFATRHESFVITTSAFEQSKHKTCREVIIVCVIDTSHDDVTTDTTACNCCGALAAFPSSHAAICTTRSSRPLPCRRCSRPPPPPHSLPLLPHRRCQPLPPPEPPLLPVALTVPVATEHDVTHGSVERSCVEGGLQCNAGVSLRLGIRCTHFRSTRVTTLPSQWSRRKLFIQKSPIPICWCVYVARK